MTHDLATLRNALRKAYDADHAATVVEIARSVLGLDPDDAFTWMRLGHALSETARYSEAEDALRKSLDLCEPKHRYFVYGEMGHLFKFQGLNGTAAEWFQKAIDDRPDDADAYVFLGSALACAGKLDDAEAAHRSATQCSDGCIDEAYLNLGLIFRALERYRDARECFKRALELDPAYKAAQDGLDDVANALAHTQHDGA